MPSSGVNKLIMRAVTDFDFRTKFLDNPATAAKAAGADNATVAELGKMDVRRLRVHFDHLSKVTTDILNPVADGHSRDWGDGNIHDKDSHIHDKEGSGIVSMQDIMNPLVLSTMDPAALAKALSDPAVAREVAKNPELKKAIDKLAKGKVTKPK